MWKTTDGGDTRSDQDRGKLRGLPDLTAGNNIVFAKTGVMYTVMGQGSRNADNVIARSVGEDMTWKVLNVPNLPSGTNIRADGVHTDPDTPNLVSLSAVGLLFKSIKAMTAPGNVTSNRVNIVPGNGFEDTGQIAASVDDPSVFYVTKNAGV
ncbi:MAG: hypothetical protein AAF762_08380 [Pseudomonadota bacterium]